MVGRQSFWVNLQARAVDAIKRAAMVRLHRSARGEAAVLTAYLWGEEATEVQFMQEAAPSDAAPWLKTHVARHLADEARHAALLRARLRILGAEPSGHPRVDPVSARKLRQLHRVAHRYTPSFSAGVSVPVFAIALHMEAMAVRVLRRHVEVLRAIPTARDTEALLSAILQDEERHQKACASVLERLVLPVERDVLHALEEEIARIERSWGVTGAVALWLLGHWYAWSASSHEAESPTERPA